MMKNLSGVFHFPFVTKFLHTIWQQNTEELKEVTQILDLDLTGFFYTDQID